jgi:hypothetical protein
LGALFLPMVEVEGLEVLITLQQYILAVVAVELLALVQTHLSLVMFQVVCQHLHTLVVIVITTL